MLTIMKWLIYGHAGWIGQQVTDHLRTLHPTDEITLGKARVDRDDVLNDEIAECRPDRVICLIGRTHGEGNPTIDYLEQPGKLVENLRDNLYAPVLLAIICGRLGIHLTYMGTGCIFAYDERHPESTGNPGFTESDPPNYFDSSYSIVKGYTDRLMHHFEGVLNVRIRMPITSKDNPRNFISKIIRYERICSIPNSMTVLDELLDVMLDMARNGKTGTINLTNPGRISHNRILDLYRQIVDPTFTYKNFSIDEQRKVLKCGRSNNYLETDRLQAEYPNVDDIETAIVKVLKAWKRQQAPS